MTKRRFAITEEQALAIRAGLALLIETLKDSDGAYDQWLVKLATDLFNSLGKYRWLK